MIVVSVRHCSCSHLRTLAGQWCTECFFRWWFRVDFCIRWGILWIAGLGTCRWRFFRGLGFNECLFTLLLSVCSAGCRKSGYSGWWVSWWFCRCFGFAAGRECWRSEWSISCKGKVYLNLTPRDYDDLDGWSLMYRFSNGPEMAILR